MKKILSVTMLIAALNCYGEGDSLILDRLDVQHDELVRIDTSHLSKLKKLSGDVDQVDQASRENAIARDFYSDNLLIVITFFSVLITITIGLIGFFIPKRNEKKYEDELKSIEAKFQDMEKQIQDDRINSKKDQQGQTLNFYNSMYYISISEKNYNAGFLWRMRFLRAYMDLYDKETYREDELFIGNIDLVKNALIKFSSHQRSLLKEYTDEVNDIFKSVLEVGLSEESREKVKHIKQEFNKEVLKEGEE